MSMAKRSASMGDVPRTNLPDENSKEKTVSDRKNDAVNAHAGIQEARERIRGMRRWRKEVERSVVWQREEFWRVEKGMGKKKGRQSVLASAAAQGKENKEGEGEGKGVDGGEGEGGEGKKEDQDGGGLSVVKTGAKWEEGKKGKWRGKDVSGERLPTQKEWEGLFG